MIAFLPSTILAFLPSTYSTCACSMTDSRCSRAGSSAIVSLYKILKSQYTAALPSKFVHIIYAMHVMRAACHVSSIYILYTIM